MKHSILGFDQQFLLDYDLDATDLIIIDWLLFWNAQGSMAKHTTVEGDTYFYFSYKKVIADLPFLGIKTKMGVYKRFDKYVEKLKKDTKYKDIPVVMVTALARDEEKRRGMEVGADAYITKGDFDQSSLIDILERLVG